MSFNQVRIPGRSPEPLRGNRGQPAPADLARRPATRPPNGHPARPTEVRQLAQRTISSAVRACRLAGMAATLVRVPCRDAGDRWPCRCRACWHSYRPTGLRPRPCWKADMARAPVFSACWQSDRPRAAGFPTCGRSCRPTGPFSPTCWIANMDWNPGFEACWHSDRPHPVRFLSCCRLNGTAGRDRRTGRSHRDRNGRD